MIETGFLIMKDNTIQQRRPRSAKITMLKENKELTDFCHLYP